MTVINQLSHLKDELKIKFRRLLIGWSMWSCLVLLFVVGIWLYMGGIPKGADGCIETWIELIVLSVVTPPVVWIIGKLWIG